MLFYLIRLLAKVIHVLGLKTGVCSLVGVYVSYEATLNADQCLCLQWIKHVDEQGRPYYYSADGSRSEWELPKVRFHLPSAGLWAKTVEFYCFFFSKRMY